MSCRLQVAVFAFILWLALMRGTFSFKPNAGEARVELKTERSLRRRGSDVILKLK